MEDYSKINQLKSYRTIEPNLIKIDDLYLKDENGNTFFEHIVKSNIKIKDNNILEYISNNYEMLQYTFQNRYILSDYYNIDLLFDKSKGACLLENLFDNNYYSLTRMPYYIIEKLFEEINGEYLIKTFAEKNIYYCDSIIKSVYNSTLLYNCFKNINRMDLMNYAKINCQLSSNPNGIPILQELIDLGISIDVYGKKEPAIADILYKKEMYSSILKMDCDTLINYPSPSNNYLDIIINMKNQDNEDIFENINLNSYDKRSLAIATIKLLRNGISFKNLNLIPTYIIDAGEKPTFIHMLEIDKELTKKYIIENSLEEDVKTYISSLNKIDKDALNNFNLDDIYKYLPNKDVLIQKVKNQEINKITNKDIYFDDLLKPMDDGITILEYLLKNNINIGSISSNLRKNLETVLIMLKYNHQILSVDEELLYKNVGNDKKLIDILMEKKEFLCISFSVKNDLRIIDYCIKYNNFKAINDDIVKQLLVEKNGKFLIEQYLDNDNFASTINLQEVDPKVIIALYNKGYKKIVINAIEKQLLLQNNNSTILEDLLDSNINPSFKGYDFLSLKTMEILYKKNRPDLMYNADLSLLMNYPSKESNYLQYIIDCYKKGINCNLELRTYIYNNKEIMARCWLQMYKNGLEGYLDNLTEKVLISRDVNGKSFLYYLINMDKDLTLNTILKSSLKKKQEIYVELKLLGVDEISMNVRHSKFDCDSIVRDIYNKSYSKDIVSPAEELLQELYELFQKDGKSDMDLIKSLIVSYRYNTSKNPIFIEELKKLIEIKKANPEFYYIKELESGYFSPSLGIVVEDPTISTINHETGHALHYYLAEGEIPDNYIDLISRISKDKNWIKRVSEYSKRYQDIKRNCKKKSEEIVSQYIPKILDEDSNKEVSNLLSKTIEEQKKIYKDKGYSDETLDIIFSKDYSLNQILFQKKEIEEDEVFDMLMRYDYDAFISIGDYIDAISLGKYRSGLLMDENGDKISPAYGHGVRYYSDIRHGFDEMVANYSEITKSKNSDEVIQLLRYIVGDELVDLVEEFYNNRILKVSTMESSKSQSI